MNTNDAINYDDAPDWAFDMAVMEEITEAEAASVMIGCDPDDLPSKDSATLRQWSIACDQLEGWEYAGKLKPLRISGAGRAYFDPNEIKQLALNDGWLWQIAPREELNKRNALRLNAMKKAIREKAKTRTNGSAPSDIGPDRLRQLEAENARLAERVADLEVELSDANEETKWSQRRFLEVIDQRDELRRQLQEATAAAQQAPQEAAPAPQQATAAPQGDDKPLTTKERNTLLKLVIGMATAYHGYDPCAKRSGTAASIVSELARLEIGIEADTVRKYLKEAAETVLPADAIKP